jgi:hypothetical protein
MKRQTLRIVAYSLGVLAWVLVIIGIGFTVIIGMAAATVIARVAFVLGGLVMTAFIAASLLAASRLIYLLIDIEENLREIAGILKEKK